MVKSIKLWGIIFVCLLNSNVRAASPERNLGQQPTDTSPRVRQILIPRPPNPLVMPPRIRIEDEEKICGLTEEEAVCCCLVSIVGFGSGYTVSHLFPRLFLPHG
jgi:hypothetical protein